MGKQGILIKEIYTTSQLAQGRFTLFFLSLYANTGLSWANVWPSIPEKNGPAGWISHWMLQSPSAPILFASLRKGKCFHLDYLSFKSLLSSCSSILFLLGSFCLQNANIFMFQSLWTWFSHGAFHLSFLGTELAVVLCSGPFPFLSPCPSLPICRSQRSLFSILCTGQTSSFLKCSTHFMSTTPSPCLGLLQPQ